MLDWHSLPFLKPSSVIVATLKIAERGGFSRRRFRWNQKRREPASYYPCRRPAKARNEDSLTGSHNGSPPSASPRFEKIRGFLQRRTQEQTKIRLSCNVKNDAAPRRTCQARNLGRLAVFDDLRPVLFPASRSGFVRVFRHIHVLLCKPSSVTAAQEGRTSWQAQGWPWGERTLA